MTEPETVQEAMALAEAQIKAANEISAVMDAAMEGRYRCPLDELRITPANDRRAHLDVVLELTSELSKANERIAALEEIGQAKSAIDVVLRMSKDLEEARMRIAKIESATRIMRDQVSEWLAE